MTDKELEKLRFVMESIQAIGAGMGGSDEDVYFVAAVARAMILAPSHVLSQVERMQKIVEISEQAQFVIEGLLERKPEQNGR